MVRRLAGCLAVLPVSMCIAFGVGHDALDVVDKLDVVRHVLPSGLHAIIGVFAGRRRFSESMPDKAPCR